MSQSTHQPSVNEPTQWWIRHHIELVEKLPEPGDRWEIRDIDGLRPQDITSLKQQGVIQKLGYIDDRSREACWWTTSPGAHAFAQQFLEHASVTPCGHTGVRCLESGETYTCCFDECDETFGREAAAEVLG